MHSHREVVKLDFSKKQLFDLVLDIETYPDFLPWCSGAKIIHRDKDNLLYADVEISYQAFKYKYTSEVKFSFQEGFIKATQLKGPFKSLENIWHFREIEQEIEVEFEIRMELKSKLLDKMLGIIFDYAYSKMMHAFIDRAKEIYTPK